MRPWRFAVLWIVLFSVSLSTGVELLSYLSYLVLFVAAAMWILSKMTLDGLSVKRSIGQTYAHLGDTIELTYELVNSHRLGKLWLEVFELSNWPVVGARIEHMFPSEIPSMTTNALGSEICSLGAHIAAATCRWLQLIGEFDRRSGADDSISARSFSGAAIRSASTVRGRRSPPTRCCWSIRASWGCRTGRSPARSWRGTSSPASARFSRRRWSWGSASTSRAMR